MSEARDTCPRCDATQMPGAVVCWLCEARLDEANVGDASEQGSAESAPVATPEYVDLTRPPQPPYAPPRHSAFSFSIGTLLLAMTIVAICTALVAALPGLGILLCIVLAPVLLRTAMVVKRRETKGMPVSMGEKAGLVAGSLVVTLVILTVVCVAAIGTFCAVCIGTFDVAGNLAWVLAFSASAVVTLAVCILFFRWSRQRYLRDIGEKNEY